MTKQNNDQNAVIITHHNGVTTCTLNRPDKLNALNADMVEGLLQAIHEATAKDSQLVVFKGAGRAFCAGFDLSDLADISDADLLLRFVRIETLPKLFIPPACQPWRWFMAGVLALAQILLRLVASVLPAPKAVFACRACSLALCLALGGWQH